jgi:plastocyanin
MGRIVAVSGAVLVVALSLAGSASARTAAHGAHEVSPAVKVTDQPLTNGTVTVASVASARPGWIAIHTDRDGKLGPVIGYTAVITGDNSNVVVRIDGAKATPKLYAVLHNDKGRVGRYQFPGVDAPTIVNGQLVSPTFSLTLPTPAVSVTNQTLRNSTVTVARVAAAEPSWIVIHSDATGKPGTDIGHTPITAGVNTTVTVKIDITKASPRLYAILHSDKGRVARYEFPGADIPAIVNGQMITPGFNLVVGTPSVIVTDQPSINGAIVVSTVVAAEQSWIAIHSDASGKPGPVIGFSPVLTGENNNVRVRLTTFRPTPRLYAILHTDKGRLGRYEFPGADVPTMVNGQMVTPGFNLTNPAPPKPATSNTGNTGTGAGGNTGGNNSGNQGQAAGGSGQTVRVNMTDDEFGPRTLTIKVGTSVRWTNGGQYEHTVTADNGSFGSGLVGVGQSFSFTFSKAGTYPYYCELHGAPGGEGMAGTIIVTE